MRKDEKRDAVSEAAIRIRNKCPDDWALIVGYIRRQTYAVRYDAEQTEVIKAEYHRKSMATQILKKFNEIEGE